MMIWEKGTKNTSILDFFGEIWDSWACDAEFHFFIQDFHSSLGLGFRWDLFHFWIGWFLDDSTTCWKTPFNLKKWSVAWLAKMRQGEKVLRVEHGWAWTMVALRWSAWVIFRVQSSVYWIEEWWCLGVWHCKDPGHKNVWILLKNRDAEGKGILNSHFAAFNLVSVMEFCANSVCTCSH